MTYLESIQNVFFIIGINMVVIESEDLDLEVVNHFKVAYTCYLI